MGMAPDGTMMVVWGQGSEVPADPLEQVRHRLYAIRCDNGRDWSAPSLVCPDVPGTTLMGFPAVAGNGRDWWILTYLADDERTEVVLLRSDHAATSFTHDRTLASRPIAADDIYLHGGYVLTHCTDVVNVGDYVGLAAHGSHLATAFVLPQSEDPMSTPTAYASVHLV